MEIEVDGWTARKFGEFCNRFKNKNEEGHDYEPLSVTKDDGIVLQSEKFNKRVANKDTSNYLIVRRGEFVYDPMSLYYGAIGRQGILDAGVVSPAYITFNVDDDIVDREYFRQLMHSELAKLEYIARTEGGNKHGKRKKTNWHAFSSIKLPFPPLPEQKKIAAILASVDEAIEATEAVIEQTRRVKKGLLEELLTRGIGHTSFKETKIGEIPEAWGVKRLSEVTREDITYGIVQAGPHIQDGVPYIRVSDMSGPTLNHAELPRTSEEISSRYERSTLEAGDVVYALRGDLGTVAIVSPELAGANLTQGTARLSPDRNSVTSQFLYWAAQSRLLVQQAEAMAKGSTFEEVALKDLRIVRIPVPPLHEQRAIVEPLIAFEAGEKKAIEKLQQMKHLKKGLLQDLLTGEVRVDVEEAEDAVEEAKETAGAMAE